MEIFRFPLPSPIVTALQGMEKASRSVAEVARDVAENGVENLAENMTELKLAETVFRANAAVVRAADDMESRLLDITA